MSAKSDIEWTDATWTAIRARNIATGKVGWHCEHSTTGCLNCYSEKINLRLGTGLPFKPGHRKDIELFLDEKMLTAPLRWKKPRMIFVCSMTDLFADFVSEDWIRAVFAVMAQTPHHTYQVLSKRSSRMREILTHWQRDGLTLREGCGAVLPNVWLGVSAERQQEADERIPDLLHTPAAVRFVSAEPLLGAINFRKVAYGRDAIDVLRPNMALRSDGGELISFLGRHPETCIDWVIAGGESGPGARPMQPEWARSIRDQCTASGVAFFFKQWHKKGTGRLLDGREWNEMPTKGYARAA